MLQDEAMLLAEAVAGLSNLKNCCTQHTTPTQHNQPLAHHHRQADAYSHASSQPQLTQRNSCTTCSCSFDNVKQFKSHHCTNSASGVGIEHTGVFKQQRHSQKSKAKHHHTPHIHGGRMRSVSPLSRSESTRSRGASPEIHPTSHSVSDSTRVSPTPSSESGPEDVFESSKSTSPSPTSPTPPTPQHHQSKVQSPMMTTPDVATTSSTPFTAMNSHSSGKAQQNKRCQKSLGLPLAPFAPLGGYERHAHDGFRHKGYTHAIPSVPGSSPELMTPDIATRPVSSLELENKLLREELAKQKRESQIARGVAFPLAMRVKEQEAKLQAQETAISTIQATVGSLVTEGNNLQTAMKLLQGQELQTLRKPMLKKLLMNNIQSQNRFLDAYITDVGGGDEANVTSQDDFANQATEFLQTQKQFLSFIFNSE